MKNLLKTLAACLVLCLFSCGDSHESQIKKAVKRQMEDYPASTLADLYKSFFQERFGPGHIVADTASARAYIVSELEGANGSYDKHYYEPTGTGSNFYRVSLALIADSVVPFDVYFNAFMNSVKNVEPVEVEQWKTDWAEILEVISAMNLNLPDFEADAASIQAILDQGKYASSHSEIYNRRYKPHYRLMKKEIFEAEIMPLIEQSIVPGTSEENEK